MSRTIMCRWDETACVRVGWGKDGAWVCDGWVGDWLCSTVWGWIYGLV